MPEAFCGGVKNVLAVCSQDTQISKAAQQRDSLLLRFKTEEEASSLRHHLSTRYSAYCITLWCLQKHGSVTRRGSKGTLGSVEEELFWTMRASA